MYLKKSVLAKEYDIGLTTVNMRIRMIREQIPDRYPRGAVITTGGIIRVRDDVFEDVMINGDAIEHNVAPAFVPHERHAWEVE
jgi:hypothetical protein